MNRPPKSLEASFARLIPPACREEVLGDLCEKYRSPLGYFFLAARTIPFVIVSRLRRINGPGFLLTDPVLIYAGFLLESWHRNALSNGDGTGFFLRLAIPAGLTWIYLLACDAFAPNPGTPPAFEPGVLIAMCAFMAYAGSLTLLNGFFAAVILVSSARLLFPSDSNPRRMWFVNSRFSRKIVAVCVPVWILLHFSGDLLWIAAAVLALPAGWFLLRHRDAR